MFLEPYARAHTPCTDDSVGGSVAILAQFPELSNRLRRGSSLYDGERLQARGRHGAPLGAQHAQRGHFFWYDSKITQRSSETVSNILNPPKWAKQGVKKGAPPKLTPKAMPRILKAARPLQAKHHPKGQEVTASLITKHAGLQISDRTLHREFAKRNIKFFKLKERPLLTRDDIKDREAWARQRVKRSPKSWATRPHATIDDKRLPMYTHAAGRGHAARRSVRGAYQIKGTDA